jgi:hypothetical protein
MIYEVNSKISQVESYIYYINNNEMINNEKARS